MLLSQCLGPSTTQTQAQVEVRPVPSGGSKFRDWQTSRTESVTIDYLFKQSQHVIFCRPFPAVTSHLGSLATDANRESICDISVLILLSNVPFHGTTTSLTTKISLMRHTWSRTSLAVVPRRHCVRRDKETVAANQVKRAQPGDYDPKRALTTH